MKVVLILIVFLITFVKADREVGLEVEVIGSHACQFHSMTQKEVQKLFLLKKHTIEGQKVVVLDSNDKELYKAFIAKYLNKSLRKIKTYWVRMLFTGKKMPPKKVSLEMLKMFGDNNVCHISYYPSVKEKMKNWKKMIVK